MSSICIEFAEKLAGLGLDQYYELLTSNGFTSWESVQQITETDMERLQMKCGGRRKLLRAIATDQGYPISQALILPSTPENSATVNSAPKHQTTGLGQYSSEHDTISPTPLQGEYYISVNCSDPVRSEYY
jgi:hypothetical protein